jgi:hypothetical protein
MSRLTKNVVNGINPSNGEDLENLYLNGNVIVNSLILIDQSDGSKWKINISDGNLIAEPLDIVNKRNFKISKILK